MMVKLTGERPGATKTIADEGDSDYVSHYRQQIIWRYSYRYLLMAHQNVNALGSIDVVPQW